MPDSTDEVKRYLDQPLDDLLQQFDLYAEESTGVQRGPGEAWNKIVPTLKQKICVEGNWCERRQDARFDDLTNIALAVMGMIGDEATRIAVPASLIAAILVKRGVDAFCGCAPVGAKQEV